MCEENGLNEFETVTLINLLPSTAEDARELIPSLKVIKIRCNGFICVIRKKEL